MSSTDGLQGGAEEVKSPSPNGAPIDAEPTIADMKQAHQAVSRLVRELDDLVAHILSCSKYSSRFIEAFDRRDRFAWAEYRLHNRIEDLKRARR